MVVALEFELSDVPKTGSVLHSAEGKIMLGSYK
jgi:hypothetical protein